METTPLGPAAHRGPEPERVDPAGSDLRPGQGQGHTSGPQAENRYINIYRIGDDIGIILLKKIRHLQHGINIHNTTKTTIVT